MSLRVPAHLHVATRRLYRESRCPQRLAVIEERSEARNLAVAKLTELPKGGFSRGTFRCRHGLGNCHPSPHKPSTETTRSPMWSRRRGRRHRAARKRIGL